MNNVTHVIKSLDLAGLLRITPVKDNDNAHEYAEFLRSMACHRHVIVIPVAPLDIPLHDGGSVKAYRPAYRVAVDKAVKA